MSTVKSKKLQVGTDATSSNNFTIYQPATPDGTLRIGVGNADSPTEVAQFNSTGIVGDGSQLTGIDPFTYTASTDPLFTTNPSAVGDSWFNSNTGEVFYCVDITTDNNVWKGTSGSTVTSVIDLYYYGDKNIAVTGDWSWNSTASASSHSVTYNSDNVYILCTGSAGTAIGIYTRWFTNNTITIPSWANTLDIYAYIVVKDSNNSDAQGDIVYGLGTTQTNVSALSYSIKAELGTQDGLFWTNSIDISGLRGQSLYFTTFGNGGQYANIQYQIYSIQIKA